MVWYLLWHGYNVDCSLTETPMNEWLLSSSVKSHSKGSCDQILGHVIKSAVNLEERRYILQNNMSFPVWQTDWYKAWGTLSDNFAPTFRLHCDSFLLTIFIKALQERLKNYKTNQKKSKYTDQIKTPSMFWHCHWVCLTLFSFFFWLGLWMW